MIQITYFFQDHISIPLPAVRGMAIFEKFPCGGGRRGLETFGSTSGAAPLDLRASKSGTVIVLINDVRI